MDTNPLPLFPLPIVLLPGEFVPLHIFEDRYREMIGLCREENIPFGIVLAEGAGHRNIGCAARIAEVTEEFPDGRLNILARGEERFRIIRVREDRSYPSAEVEYFGDRAPGRAEEALPADLVEKALAALSEARGEDRPPGGGRSGGEPERDELRRNPGRLSFLAGAALDLPPRAKQLLLESDSAGERMKMLVQMIERQHQGAALSDATRRNVTTNGHPKK